MTGRMTRAADAPAPDSTLAYAGRTADAEDSRPIERRLLAAALVWAAWTAGVTALFVATAGGGADGRPLLYDLLPLVTLAASVGAVVAAWAARGRPAFEVLRSAATPLGVAAAVVCVDSAITTWELWVKPGPDVTRVVVDAAWIARRIWLPTLVALVVWRPTLLRRRAVATAALVLAGCLAVWAALPVAELFLAGYLPPAPGTVGFIVLNLAWPMLVLALAAVAVVRPRQGAWPFRGFGITLAAWPLLAMANAWLYALGTGQLGPGRFVWYTVFESYDLLAAAVLFVAWPADRPRAAGA